MKKLLIIILTLSLSAALFASDKKVPTVEDLLAVKTLGGTSISPDGRWIAYSIREADLEEDAYLTQIWIAGIKTGETWQLTQGKSSCSNYQWSPCSKWLSFTSAREKKNQIYVIRPNGGEALKITDAKEGISDYKWSPDGASILFTMRDEESKDIKDRKDHMGAYNVVRREYRHTHLYIFDTKEAFDKPAKGEGLTSGKELTVSGFNWSPDGSQIAFSASINPDRINWDTTDLYVYTFSDSTYNKIVDQPGPDSYPQWSPDGKTLLFSTSMGNPQYYPQNSELATVPAQGGEIRKLTGSFDENPYFVHWDKNGIYFAGMKKTASHLYLMNLETMKYKRVTDPDDLIASGYSFTKDGKTMSYTAESATSMKELYVTPARKMKPRKLTDMTQQTEPYILGTREVISWNSKDGTEIEGVLIKPADFDPSKKYPLLCVIHGGPTGIDRPVLLTRGIRYYPVDIWTGRGALVLRVNYRGSAGYGEAFRKLNMRNLGVGDAWDVLSGVDYLIDKGWIDTEKIGCMGWSQGGYISAFLTTSSDRFTAISVGAGISNWATYYYNTDITPFCPFYLGDDPAADPEIYAKTSPMTHILKARTPTLIQHGENDQRVPIPNAYELRQGLVDMGVPVEMVVYSGYGHGITKPKSQRAVMWHNLAWFGHYIFGDELPELWKPEIPKSTE
ncbi:S9 family peptidase [bacterium]|nr:S9 family peptidase [bacterium]